MKRCILASAVLALVMAACASSTSESEGTEARQATAVDTYDLHATVLNQLGLDHLRVTYLNQGRSERPTVVYGRVVKEILA